MDVHEVELSVSEKRGYSVLRMIFLMIVRTLVNTLHRMVYPFLPVFARELGVTPAVFSNALALRSATGIFSPLFSRFADSRGRKFGMLLGMFLFLAGLLFVVLWPRFEIFLLGLVLASLGKYALDPSIQAYIGDEVPLAQRGEAIAIVEFGWALSYFAGVYGVRLLLEQYGWQSPFPIFSLLAVAAILGILVFIPSKQRADIQKTLFWQRVFEILRSKSARYALLVGFMISAANELFSLVFAVWLEDSFGFKLAALTGAAVLIGLSELFGETLVGTFTDRLGSRTAVRYGILANCLIALLFPIIARSVAGASVSLFLFYFSFEYTIVSSLSMMTELKTESKATLMGMNVAGLSLGRMVSALIAIPIYGGGIILIIFGVLILNLIGFISLFGVRLK